MVLPADEWEHLQDQVRRYHNKLVGKYFKNQSPNDISTPKSSLRHACTIKDADTDVMTLMRLWLFEITVGHAQSLQAPIYGIPVQEFRRVTKFKPQIKLHFKEPYDRAIHEDQGFNQVRGEITFRLMEKDSDSISRTDALSWASKIKSDFATPPFEWKKGWFKATYLDIDHGYDLRLLVPSKSEGERIARAVVGMGSDTYSSNNFQFIEHNRSYPAIPGTHRVYGSTVRKARERPRVDLKFTHAQMLIDGKMTAINLVAMAGMRLSQVIETV
ncbi:hypothetical protein WJM97_22315 [Okeanomitos corallinicola TIOX110]|uniref:Uncharacterized protein n=1 Tax=Okeanomitos corallinicola TIOX110 TaxID=3133117 RepID=A0ABZ2UUK1_9CYAN